MKIVKGKNDIMTMKEAKSIIAVLRVSRVYGASALWVCEIILWLVRAFLRVPAMPFLWVAELYYRLRRFRQELWADAMDAAALVKRSQTEPSTQDLQTQNRRKEMDQNIDKEAK